MPNTTKKTVFTIAIIIACVLGAIWLREQCYVEVGMASRYSDYFKGRKTASGERYDPEKLTAAHLTLPLGSVVKVTNLKNRNQVTVKINDRGPHVKGRIIDLSRAAARKLDMIKEGVVKVKIERVK